MKKIIYAISLFVLICFSIYNKTEEVECSSHDMFSYEYENCKFYCLINEDDTITITREAKNPGKTINIPKYINGKLVTKIGSSAFEDCKMTKIILPDTIIGINKYAFKNCSNVEEIKIPKGVRHIGLGAFSYFGNNCKFVWY